MAYKPIAEEDNWTWGDGHYVVIHGIYFKSDGSVAPGTHGYYEITPEMWREGTTNYRVAKDNLEHLEEYRAEAMERWKHDKEVIKHRIKDQEHGIEWHSSWHPGDLYSSGTIHSIDLDIPNDFEGFCANAEYVEPEVEITSDGGYMGPEVENTGLEENNEIFKQQNEII